MSDNKNFNDSPRLLIDYNKLQTEVNLNYQIKSQLTIEIEFLKSSELKNNLQFIVIETPSQNYFRSNTIFEILIKNTLLLFFGIFILSSIGTIIRKN